MLEQKDWTRHHQNRRRSTMNPATTMLSRRWSITCCIPRVAVSCLAVCCVVVSCSSALGARSDWAEGSAGRSTGASRDYYNSAASLKWRNFMGDWRDVNDTPQGANPYATVHVKSNGKIKPIVWDATRLVRRWREGKFANQGFFLRQLNGNGAFVLHSREHAAKPQQPQLIVETETGAVTLSPSADTYLEPSTYRSMGNIDQLKISSKQNALLRFNLDRLPKDARIRRATLRLVTFRQYGREGTIGLFRCAQGHDEPTSDPISGLASRYPADDGIGGDAHVIFATQFESDQWSEEWTRAGEMRVIDTVAADAERQFAPHRGKALRVRIAKGANGALNTLFKFKQETGAEPEEVYFRYYLRLASDWNQTLQGGKLPGISGTYGIAGWGGRKSNGRDGWSARGLFKLTIPDGNPLAGTTPIGTYCYHADMEGSYGANWVWQKGYRGFLENNRWYSVEQYLKLNSPAKQDGVIRAWIDGRLAFEKTDIRFRNSPKLRIEQVWMNVYHGGKQPSPKDQHVFIDNVVIATKYIGPIRAEKREKQ